MVGSGEKNFLVECEKCKQWISGDSLGLVCIEHALKGKGGRKKLGSGRRRQ